MAPKIAATQKTIIETIKKTTIDSIIKLIEYLPVRSSSAISKRAEFHNTNYHNRLINQNSRANQ
jgi:hypothetical protein